MQEPTAVSHEEQNLPPSAMESSEKSSTVQELPPNQVQSSQPIYPTTTPPGPPDTLAHPPYPLTTMPGGPPPVMYPPAYPTTHVVTAQPPGTYPAYHSNVVLANTAQPQPVYTMPMAPQPQYPPTNLPPYPITTAPGAHPPYMNQPAYTTPTVIGSQQPYIVYQDPNPSMVTTEDSAVVNSRPKDYLCWSILSMLFCVCPLGIVAVVFSSKTSDAVAKQDWMAARRYSGRAFLFNLLSLLLGIIFYIVIIALRLG